MVAISLDLLEILDAIDRRGSFATAAEELNRVPSALSYTVQKYEDALGFSIFVRQGRRSVFTPSGRLLLEQGRELLKGAAALADGARTLASGWEPRLDIAVDSLLSFDTLMPVLAHFLNDHPSVEIDIQEEVLGGTWEALIEDRVQLVIGAPEPKPRISGIRAEVLGEVERVFAVSPDHALAQSDRPLTPQVVGEHRMVVVHDSSRSQIPRNTRLLNEDKHFYVGSIYQKIAAQKAGIGVGFLPKSLIERELNTGELVALVVEQVHLKDRLYLAWKSSNRGQGLKRLVQMLRSANLVS